jgi:hypothetical protein
VTKFDSVIPPGSEGKVYSTVDINHTKGAISKHIELKTNDPKNSTFTLFIKANVKPIVDVQPDDDIRFVAEKGHSQSEVRILAPNFVAPFTLGAPVSDLKMVDVKISAPKAGKYTLTALLKSDVPIGNYTGSIKLPVAGGPLKEFAIPVTVVVRGPIQVDPQSVAFVIRTYPEEVTSQKAVNITLRDDPASKVVGKINPGINLRTIGQKGNVYQIITSEKVIGWVPKSAFKVVKPPEVQTAQNVSIRKNNGKNFKVLTYNSSLPNLKVEMQPKDQVASTFDMKLTLLQYDTSKKSNVTGSIVIKTDDADQPELKIPIYIIVS